MAFQQSKLGLHLQSKIIRFAAVEAKRRIFPREKSSLGVHEFVPYKSNCTCYELLVAKEITLRITGIERAE